MARSTFCWRASVSSRSSGPSKPSTSTTSAGSSGRPLRKLGLELQYLRRSCVSLRRLPDAGHQLSEFGAAAPRDRSASAAFRAASAAAARRAASPASTGASAATASISGISPVAMEHHVAAGRDARRGFARRANPTRRPWKCRQLINRPLNPIESRITSRTIVAEMVAGATGSRAVNTTCAVIADRQRRQRPKGGEIGRFQDCPIGC